MNENVALKDDNTLTSQTSDRDRAQLMLFDNARFVKWCQDNNIALMITVDADLSYKLKKQMFAVTATNAKRNGVNVQRYGPSVDIALGNLRLSLAGEPWTWQQRSIVERRYEPNITEK